MSTPFKIITNQGQIFPLSDMIYTFSETGYVPKYAKDCLEDVNWVNDQTSLNFSADNRTLKVFPLITDWSTYTDDSLSFHGQELCKFDENQTFTLKNGISPNGFRDVHGITDLVFTDQNTPTDPVDLECVFYNMPQLETISGFYTADNKEFKAITIGKANNLFDGDTNLTGQENFEISFYYPDGLLEANSMMYGNTHATGLPTLTGTANVKRWDNSFNGYGYDVATTLTVGSYGNLEITLVNRSQVQDPDGDVANVHKMIHNALMIGSLTINGSGGPDPDDNGRWCPVYWEEIDLDNELVDAWLHQLKIYVDSTLLSEYISRNKERCGGDSTKEAYVDAIFDDIYKIQYFTIEPLANGTISFSKSGLSYSTDKSTWSSLGTSALSVTQGQNVYLKGNMTPSESEPKGIGTLSATANFNVSGNAMSLLFGDNFIGQTSLSGKNCAFYSLFKNNAYLINANNLILPATTLSDHCYQEMFYGCSYLITAPKLPATTLSPYCYQDMINRCPVITTAPELPATTLTEKCYFGMFYGSSSINYVKCLATDISATEPTVFWLWGVSSTGTFVKDPNMTSWTTGYNGIPNNWTVEDYSE